MRIEIKANHDDECYDLIDVESDQSHDGDGARELIAKVYSRNNAVLIANALTESHCQHHSPMEIKSIKTDEGIYEAGERMHQSVAFVQQVKSRYRCKDI